ncbi:MAG: FkbM family methyltransferase [Sphingosinicella sp.]
MKLLRKASTFLFMLRRRPKQAIELLQLRTEGRLGISLHFLSPRRALTRRFELRNTRQPAPGLVPYGNYLLDPELLGPRPVVFSLGVGQFIDFDRALLDRHDVKLFLFDPTPASARFISSADLPANAHFASVAVADHDGEIEMFTDDLESDFEATSSVSMINRGFHAGGFTVPCRRVGTLMKEHDVTRLDVIKLDIEGAAIAVLNDMLDAGILPTQIAAEFERPESLREVRAYIGELDRLFGRLKTAGYCLYRTRPELLGCQVEILAVRSGAAVDRAAPRLAKAAASSAA